MTPPPSPGACGRQPASAGRRLTGYFRSSPPYRRWNAGAILVHHAWTVPPRRRYRRISAACNAMYARNPVACLALYSRARIMGLTPCFESPAVPEAKGVPGFHWLVQVIVK